MPSPQLYTIILTVEDDGEMSAGNIGDICKGLPKASSYHFKTVKPITAEKFSFVAELGRFIIERDYNLQGAARNCLL